MYLFDIILIVLSSLALIASFFLHLQWLSIVITTLAFIGLAPVVWSAVKALFKRKISIDLLASVALIFSLYENEWFSALFITLMLAFARLFDRLTEMRVKKTIESLLKYKVEKVRIRIGDNVKEISIHDVKVGNLIIVEAGDRVPVDGFVVSGEAEIDESSLTGESELVAKKRGDKVFTSTINDAGSLIVHAERVGEDTTLSRLIKLVDESSREKSPIERSADRFANWYIFLSLLASGVMYILGLAPREILAILLVVCADDIAVAVPLGFTAAIAYAAKRGIVVKGGGALEQLSRIKYLLTDKTGTLTRGRPMIVEIKAFNNWSKEEVLKNFVSGASESRHAITRAIVEYAEKLHIKAHLPDELEEIPGQGIVFKHDNKEMLIGRLSFMESRKCHISEEIKEGVKREKERGLGISCLSVNGIVVGFVTYRDELRPRAKEIIEETKTLGVKEWHMLTGDNENAAKIVARELALPHFHANMSPEDKVQFIHEFKKNHRTKGNSNSTIGFIGDGVNDAASLALADVSIAMGGIGASSSIEASDITIIRDQLSKVPEVIKIAQKARKVMKVNFWIWGFTNIVGLSLVVFGVIGPGGAAVFNFVTDFFPIFNAFRAGRK